MNNKDIHEMYCAMFNEGIIPLWFDTLENRASFFELTRRRKKFINSWNSEKI